MAATRLRRARTAASVVVLLGASAVPIASATQSLAAAAVRSPEAHARRVAARRAAELGPVSVPQPPAMPVPGGLEGASGTSVGASPGSEGSTPAPVAHVRRSARETAGDTAGRLRRAGLPRRVVRQVGGRRPAKGENPVGEPVSQAGEAVSPALSGLTENGPLSRKRSGGGRRGKGPGGGHRKHRTGSGEPPAVSVPTSSAPSTPAPAVAVPATNTHAAAPAAPAAPAPVAKASLVAPQIAASTSQPFSGLAHRTAPGGAGRARSRGVETTLLAAAASPGASTGTPTVATRPAAARAHASSPASNNPLERIGRHIPLPIPVPDWSKPVIIALLLLAVWFGIRARLAGARARGLERQRAGLLRDMDTMQAALVPEVPGQLGGLDVSVAYRPAEGPAAGGDFYDLFIPQPGMVAIMLGDVSGHGHEALTHAALTRYTLRAYLQAGLEPRTALSLAGRVLTDPTGARYATVALAVYESATGTLTYALAGHPPPMLLGVSGARPVTACSSPPVGWGVPTGRRQTTISLPAGAEACFFSDGLIEARRDGQLLGRGQLREILAGLGPRPVAEELLEQVRTAAQEAPDDMVACVLTPQASGRETHVHVEELEVDSAMLARGGVVRFLRECGLTPAKLTHALQLAADTAAADGSALLRIELSRQGATVTVTAPPSHGAPSTSRADSDPLLHAPELIGAETIRARALA